MLSTYAVQQNERFMSIMIDHARTRREMHLSCISSKLKAQNGDEQPHKVCIMQINGIPFLAF